MCLWSGMYFYDCKHYKFATHSYCNTVLQTYTTDVKQPCFPRILHHGTDVHGLPILATISPGFDESSTNIVNWNWSQPWCPDCVARAAADSTIGIEETLGHGQKQDGEDDVGKKDGGN